MFQCSWLLVYMQLAQSNVHIDNTSKYTTPDVRLRVSARSSNSPLARGVSFVGDAIIGSAEGDYVFEVCRPLPQ